MVAAQPSVIGGDMESWGLYTACHSAIPTPEWLMVKGICDWGDDSKNDGFQPLAAANATLVVEYILRRRKV